MRLAGQDTEFTGAEAPAGAAASGCFGSAALGVAFGCITDEAISSGNDKKLYRKW